MAAVATTQSAAAAPGVAYISLLSSSPPVIGARAIPPANRYKTGSRAAPIPEGAITGFRSVSLLIKEGGVGDTEGIEENASKSKPKQRKKLSTASKIRVDDLEEAEEEKEGRELKSKQREKSTASMLELENLLLPENATAKDLGGSKLIPDNSGLVEGEEDSRQPSPKPKPKPKPKTRRRRSGESKLKLDKRPSSRRREARKGQTSLRIGKVTKVGVTAPTPDQKVQTFKYPPGYIVTGEASKYFQKNVADSITKKATEPIQLGEASKVDDGPCGTMDPQIVKNSAKWKPAAKLGPSDSAIGFGCQGQLDSEKIPPAKSPPIALDDLAGDTAYDATIATSEGLCPKSNEDKPLAKRRAAPISTKQKTTKIKGPLKRKLVTITANAIAKIRDPTTAQKDHLDPSSQDPTVCQDLFDIFNVNKPHILTSKARNSTSKPGLQDGAVTKKRKSKTKKPVPIESKLRSPESAGRRMRGQRFIFGTSSQIVREEDPTAIRDLQRAIKASEGEAAEQQTPERTACALETGKKLPVTSPRLWFAGAEGDGQICTLVRQQPTNDPRDLLQENVPSNVVKVNSPSSGQDSFPRFLNTSPIELVDFPSKPTISLDTSAQDFGAKGTGSKLKLSSAPLARPKLIFGGLLRRESPLSIHVAKSQIMPWHATVPALAVQMSTAAGTKSNAESQEKSKGKSSNKAAATTAPAKDGVEPPPPKRPRGRPRKDGSALSFAPKPTVKKRKKGEDLEQPGAKNKVQKKQEDKDEFALIDEIDDQDPQTPKKTAKPRKNAVDLEKGGRKKKAQTKEVTGPEEFVPIDEIEDNDPSTPSPPRRKSPSVPAQLELSAHVLAIDATADLGAEISEEARALAEAKAKAEAEAKAKAKVEAAAKAKALAEAAAKAKAEAAAKAKAQAEAKSRAEAAARIVLFAQISKAIKNAPRSTDPNNPSWWEKILMYDPIILEDLTAWLNDGALEASGGSVPAVLAVAEDGTGGLKPSVVRKWCDKHSVCCVWRDGSEWR